MKAKEKSEKALERVFNEINEDYRAALRLGVPRSDLKKIISRMRVGAYPANEITRNIVLRNNFKGLTKDGKIR